MRNSAFNSRSRGAFYFDDTGPKIVSPLHKKILSVPSVVRWGWLVGSVGRLSLLLEAPYNRSNMLHDNESTKHTHPVISDEN